jgi:hypothetical protein
MPPQPDNSVAKVATNKKERRKRERKCMAATSDGRASPAPAGEPRASAKKAGFSEVRERNLRHSVATRIIDLTSSLFRGRLLVRGKRY